VLPSTIGARYGSSPDVPMVTGAGHLCTVNVSIEQTGPIKSISCPSSHPISFELGRQSQSKPDVITPDSHHATVRFVSQKYLQNDFILSIKAENLDTPRAIIEPHPSPDQHTSAMALTLVPRFRVPDIKGGAEYVFLVDRSGSMRGNRINAAKKALIILLRGLPTKDTLFNIWSFGTSSSALWTDSKVYNASTLDEATRHVDSMSANFRGTETRAALERLFESRSRLLPHRAAGPTNVFVLTDGDAWDVSGVIGSVKGAVETSPAAAPLRVFCLGIGSSISTAMCEGIGRAGTGFALFVGDGEDMVGKCAKLVRAARTPPVENIQVEWLPGLSSTAMDPFDDGFEVVEAEDLKENIPEPKKIDLFTSNENEDPVIDLSTGPPSPIVVKPDDLPEELVQQGPYKIPAIYPGVRFLVYAIVSDKVLPTGGKMPEKVIVRGKIRGTDDSVELEVPVQVAKCEQGQDATGLSVPVHTLAARRLVTCLEDSEHNFSEVIRSSPESVQAHIKAKIIQLGCRYDITSKHTSFVAVDRRNPPALLDVSVPSQSPRPIVAFPSLKPRLSSIPHASNTSNMLVAQESARPLASVTARDFGASVAFDGLIFSP
jgi:hypothetical protein